MLFLERETGPGVLVQVLLLSPRMTRLFFADGGVLRIQSEPCFSPDLGLKLFLIGIKHCFGVEAFPCHTLVQSYREFSHMIVW